MTFDEISKQKFAGNILIVGDPATGKSRLSDMLSHNHPGHEIIHTDVFMDNGYEKGLYDIMQAIKNSDKPTLVEGVQGFRLLRKGLQQDSPVKYNPDNVIHLHSPKSSIQKAYETDYKRLGKDTSKLDNLAKANITILEDYRKLNNHNRIPPVWYDVDNAY